MEPHSQITRAARWVLILLASGVLAALVGCPRKDSNADAAALVNGKKILRSEVEKYFNNQTNNSPVKPEAEQADGLRLNILRELVDQEIMMQRAEKLSLLASDDEVDAKLAEIKAPYTQEEFAKRLSDQSLTVDDLRREIRRNLTIQKVINKEITSRIVITDADITGYYNQHKAEFNLIEPQYHLAQIVVSPRPDPNVHNLQNDKAQNEAAARSKIQQIMNGLEQGEDFATMAMKYSEDQQTASNGGDMGFMPESSLKDLDPSTREAVMRLNTGRMSGIVTIVHPVTRQLMLYRIVKVLGKEPAGQRDLNDPRVQQAIREQLRQRREQLLKFAFYEQLRNEAKVENMLADEILKKSVPK